MAKTKHIHVIEATVTLRKEFDQRNLIEAGKIQEELRAAASKMDGFHAFTSRMTKAPVVDPLAVPPRLARV